MYKYQESKKRRILRAIAGAGLLLVAGTLAVFYGKNGKSTVVDFPTTQLADTNPKFPIQANKAMFFSDDGYRGRVLILDVYNNPNTNLPSIGWNDDITSFKIGPGVRVKMCSNAGCRGNSWSDAIEIVGPYHQPNIDSYNDWASEIQLFPYSPQKEKFVQVFGDQRFDADQAGLFPAGDYTSEDIKSRHIDKGGYGGAASSMLVPAGMIVTIFNRDYYDGDSLSILGPAMVDLMNDKKYQGWNDQIRSMTIADAASVDVSVSWEQVNYGSGNQ